MAAQSVIIGVSVLRITTTTIGTKPQLMYMVTDPTQPLKYNF